MKKQFNPSISVEKFAAFLDGNLNDQDREHVLSMLSNDSSLSQIIEVNDTIDEILDDYEGNSFDFSSEIDDSEIVIPDLSAFMDNDLIEIESNLFHDDEDLFDTEVIENAEQLNLYEKGRLNDVGFKSNTNLNTIDMEDENIKQNEDSQGAMAAMSLFGSSSQGAKVGLDPMIFQGNEGICAIRSQQIILRDYGIDVSIDELKQFAIENGWYDPNGGTPIGYIGCLLESCNVHCRQDSGCTVYDLVNELSQGHRVIVALDANELWADRDNDLWKQTKEWFTDVFKGETPNHALVVAGVEVNPTDPDDVKVILTDPGTGDLRIEYKLGDFMDAWEDSDCFMTTTTEPAPLQYDPNKGCEVPSNFAMEQFIDAHSLPLNANNIILPSEIAAMSASAHYSEGHLDAVPFEGKEVDFEHYTQAVGQAHQQYKSVISGGSHLPGQDYFDKEAFVSSIKHMLGFGSSSDPESEPIPEPIPVPEPDPDPDPDSDLDIDDDDDDDNNDFSTIF
jgi:hypothetical protein